MKNRVLSASIIQSFNNNHIYTTHHPLGCVHLALEDMPLIEVGYFPLTIHDVVSLNISASSYHSYVSPSHVFCSVCS